jgi:hypothetical protein
MIFRHYRELTTEDESRKWFGVSRSQCRLPLEFMGGLSYTVIIEFAELLACRRGSTSDC